MKCSGTGPCTKAARESSLLAFLRLAPFAASQYFVRFRTKADKVRFWPGTVCPLLTQSGHWRVFLCRKLPSSSLKAVNFEQTWIPDRLITILGASPQFRAPKSSGRRRWCSPTRRLSRSRAGDFSLDQVSRFSSGRDAMTIYISRGRFTSDAVKGMVANPEIVSKPSPNSARVSAASSSGGT